MRTCSCRASRLRRQGALASVCPPIAATRGLLCSRHAPSTRLDHTTRLLPPPPPCSPFLPSLQPLSYPPPPFLPSWQACTVWFEALGSAVHPTCSLPNASLRCTPTRHPQCARHYRGAWRGGSLRGRSLRRPLHHRCHECRRVDLMVAWRASRAHRACTACFLSDALFATAAVAARSCRRAAL